jgi:tetratricopeptide (TPR) repeat protein
MKEEESESRINAIAVGRGAHAKVFDEPVNLSRDDKEAELIAGKLREYAFEGNPAKFRRWLRHYTPAWRDNARAQHCMGLAFKFERRYDEAERCFNAALELLKPTGSPKAISTVLMELSVISLARNDDQDAWRLLNLAMKTAPDNWLTHYNRIALASASRSKTKVSSAYRQMCKLCSAWHEDPDAREAFLSDDGELHYLRVEMPCLWEEIKKRLK